MSSTSKKTAQDSGCTPFSVAIAVLTPDDQHEIHFGLTKGCNPDNSAFWLIDFMLKEFKNGQMKTRVEVHVTVGKELQPKAEDVAKAQKLTPEKVDLLNGPVADRAKNLPEGTTQDKKLNQLLTGVIS
jgi:hypothetical protein